MPSLKWAAELEQELTQTEYLPSLADAADLEQALAPASLPDAAGFAQEELSQAAYWLSLADAAGREQEEKLSQTQADVQEQSLDPQDPADAHHHREGPDELAE